MSIQKKRFRYESDYLSPDYEFDPHIDILELPYVEILQTGTQLPPHTKELYMPKLTEIEIGVQLGVHMDRLTLPKLKKLPAGCTFPYHLDELFIPNLKSKQTREEASDRDKQLGDYRKFCSEQYMGYYKEMYEWIDTFKNVDNLKNKDLISECIFYIKNNIAYYTDMMYFLDVKYTLMDQSTKKMQECMKKYRHNEDEKEKVILTLEEKLISVGKEIVEHLDNLSNGFCSMLRSELFTRKSHIIREINHTIEEKFSVFPCHLKSLYLPALEILPYGVGSNIKLPLNMQNLAN